MDGAGFGVPRLEPGPGPHGGMVVQVEDNKFDATISRQLRQLHDDLIERASREIHSGKRYFEDVQN